MKTLTMNPEKTLTGNQITALLALSQKKGWQNEKALSSSHTCGGYYGTWESLQRRGYVRSRGLSGGGSKPIPGLVGSTPATTDWRLTPRGVKAVKQLRAHGWRLIDA